MNAPKTIALLVIVGIGMVACGEQQVSFKNQINPILQENCSVCHKPGAPGFVQSGFSVASYADVMKGTKNGQVIEPGSSVGSTLVRLIRHQADKSINMPKNYSQELAIHNKIILPENGARLLPAAEIELIARWVDQGAKNN
ncbi:MAG: c-type cytochrome domain-containing protein [Rudaea sp.]